MCDEHTEQDNERHLQARGITRRQLGAVAAGTGLMMMLPPMARAQDVIETEVNIATPDGSADCYFVHPTEGAHAGVLVWPDILGLRPAFRQMGKRLAQSGYAVLVVNPFYRTARSPVVAAGASFSDPAVREKVLPMARVLNAQTHVSDAQAFIGWLDRQQPVATQRKIGTTGYCMGGPMVMRTCAAVPERVGAGATFHGGGLVTEGSDSPHRLIPQMKSRMLIAIAANDDEREPEAKSVLRKSFKQHDIPAEIEVYEGAMHGWCPPDSAVYNAVQAEKAWSRLLVLLESALGTPS